MTALRNLLVALTLLLWSVPADAAARYAVCTVTCTWDTSSTAMWSASTGGTTGASVPTTGDAVTLDAATCVGGATCTITVNGTVTADSITMSTCTATTTGCILDFSVNNNNVNLLTFSNSGTGTRNLKMGNGTWTISGTGTIWNQSTITNLTFAANSSTLAFTATTNVARTIILGALTYNAVTISANTGSGTATFSGASTVGTVNIIAPNNIIWGASTTYTISNAFNFAGSSGSEISMVGSTSAGATISVASGSPTMAWTALRDLFFTGGATFTATSSFNLGNNTGITITPPTAGSGGGRIIGG